MRGLDTEKVSSSVGRTGLFGLATDAAHFAEGRPRGLTYHEIGPQRSSGLEQISCEEIGEHFRTVASLREASPSGFAIPQITFDDGHISNFLYAPPLLEKYGLKGTFFLVANQIGNLKKTMSWEQARELVAMGHQIHSHSWSHRPLPSCSDADLDMELRRSLETIEDRLGSVVDAISMPYGRWDRRVLAACARAGYRRVFTSDRWLVPGVRSDVMVYGRLTVYGSMSPEYLHRMLTLKGLLFHAEQAKYQAKQAMKRLIGDRIYHRLWSRFVGPDEAA